MIPWLLAQLEKDPTTTFSKRELLRQSEAEFGRLEQAGLLTYVQTDPESDTYPCSSPCAKTCPMQIVEVRGQFYAMCPEDSEVDPVLLEEDDLHKYAFSIQKLLEEIRKANGLSGSLHQIEPDYSYVGYTQHGGRRVGFVFSPAMHRKSLLELSGLKQLCTDDEVLVVFNSASATEDVCLKRELHLRGVVKASLASSVDFETFCVCIEGLIPQVSGGEEKILAIDRERSEVTYRGKAYCVTQRQIDLLEALCKQPGAWVPGSQVKRRYDERLDKVKTKLPAPIRKLIESHTVNGYRLNLS